MQQRGWRVTALSFAEPFVNFSKLDVAGSKRLLEDSDIPAWLEPYSHLRWAAYVNQKKPALLEE